MMLHATLTPFHFECKGQVIATFKHPWVDTITWGDCILIKGAKFRVLAWCDITSTYIVGEGWD